MSNQPDSANPSAPNSPSSTSNPESTSTATESPRKGSSIRIGTQRYGTKPPVAVPQPVLVAPSLAGQRQPAAAAEGAVAPEAVSPAPTVAASSESPLSESAVDVSTGSESTSGGPTSAAAPAISQPAPGDRPRGGKKPGGFQPKPSRPPQMVTPQASKVALPNIRAQLSPELEMEYLEALGGGSLEEMISHGKDVKPELEPESRHRGKVITVHRDSVFVDIGGRQQGLIQLKSFATEPEPGTELEVMVSRFDPAEGLYELVLPGGTVDVGDWSEVAEGMVVEARVTGHNKGGLECEVNKLRGFIPASQVSMYRVEDLSQFVDQKFACVITEANPEKRNLVLSRRGVLEREKAEAKEKMMASLEVGQTHEGTVRSLQNFGAFVDLGGVDGLIHISQLSWDRIKHASEVLEVGQKVKVKIQKIDPQTGKIGLAFRDLAENPWANAARDFPARSRVKGTVSRLMEFGAFVRLMPGVEGLIHISELSHKRVFRVSDVLQEGQEVEVQVLSIDPEQQRISLSLKALEAKAAPVEKVEEPEEPEVPVAPPKPRKVPLKGGVGGPSHGEKFGLKW